MKQEIKPSELHALMQSGHSFRIVDVRSPAEFRSGHIYGAANVPLGAIGERIPDVREDESIVIVCQAGGRSTTACRRVASFHRSLYNLTGGTGAWIAAGLPVERPPTSERRLPQNIGSTDKAIRTAAGVSLFGLLAFVQTGVRWIGLLGVVPLVTAIVGFCPLYAVLRWHTSRNAS